MAFGLELRILIKNCHDDELSEVEAGLLIDYCEERLNETTPERLLQALAEVLSELHDSELLEGETMH
tara:strand:- start:293 stop:493 length:201 start_codon:yes stop_codon:yes gene_type:complete